MNDFNNSNTNNKYTITTTDYILQEKIDKNGQVYYLIINKQGEKNPDGTDIAYFCFPLKPEHQYYPGTVFTNLKELYERGYKFSQDEPCIELKLGIMEFVNKNGREVRRILKAEWTK